MTRIVVRQIVIVLLASLVIRSAAAADWPTYRFDSNRSGATPEELKFPLKRAWLYRAPATPRLAWAGPEDRTIEGQKLRHRVKYDDAFHVAIVGNRLFFGSSVDHQLRCLDLTTGKELWTFFTGGPVRLAPTVWQNQVLFGSDDGYVYNLHAETGKLNWKLRAGPADDFFLGRGEMISRWAVRTGITIFDGAAYFGAGVFPHEGVMLYAVDAESGKVLWKRDDISEEDAGRNPLSPQGYLLANTKYLFIPSGRALPACFDRKTGQLVHHRTHSWRREGVLGGTRALLADNQIYAAGPHQMIALDQKNGNVGFGYFDGKEMVVSGKWAYAVDGAVVKKMDRAIYAKASRARHNLENTIVDLMRKLRDPGKDAAELKKKLAELSNQLEAIEKKGVVWSAKSKSMSALLATANHVFVGGEDRVDGLDLKTGRVVWSQQVEGEARGLAAANGYLFVSTTAGKIYAFADANQPTTKEVLPSEKKQQPYPKDELTSVYESAAEEILQHTGVTKGFCLVLGAEQGRLAYELAKRSELIVYGIEPDAEKVAEARRVLSDAGLYGHRIIMHQANLADIPYSNYFANLVVSDNFLLTGKLPPNPKNFISHVKPLGGTVCLGSTAKAVGKRASPKETANWLDEMAFSEIGEMKAESAWQMFVRGKLRGAGNWTHQYGEPGNTASSDDQIVKGGLGVLWYGDPGPGKMVNRHEGAVGPLSVDGRLIVQGQFAVMAYDAYNGMFLWEYHNPRTHRTGVFQNNNAGNLAAGDGNIFVMEGTQVVQLDASTGKLKNTWKLPPEKREQYEWGYFAYQDGLLFGTATIRKELAAYLKRRGLKYDDKTDAIFAIGVKSGKYLWTYEGQNIAAQTVALGPDRVYFIDSSITKDQREAILLKYKGKLDDPDSKQTKLIKERIKRLDVRMAIALDANSGKKLWEQPVDVTDCSKIGIGGGELTLIHANDTLLLCGANANGHYWRQFVAGEFKVRRLVALSAKDGKRLWAKDANYRHRPIIIGAKVIAEPWAFDLFSGKQLMRKHPLTGQDVPWSIIRPGHHCGMLVGCPNLLMFRSGYTGFYDLYRDSGTQHFAGHRLGCWINAIPANGLVMIPEASAGCVCQFSIAATITMAPLKKKSNWTIYSAVGSSTPVQHMALNLGAPGDRKDGHGQIWLSYPRPVPGRTTGLDLPLDLQEVFAQGGGFKSVSEASARVKALNSPTWLYSSWAQDLTEMKLPLLGPNDAPATYTVRLYFADVEKDAKSGQRNFDVKIQGKTVLKDFDPASARQEDESVFIQEVENVHVERDLLLQLLPENGAALPPILNAVEVIKEK